MGIGMDRLVMLLILGQQTIQEVLSSRKWSQAARKMDEKFMELGIQAWVAVVQKAGSITMVTRHEEAWIQNKFRIRIYADW